jgi:carboxypeptidase C (cathepsin A)
MTAKEASAEAEGATDAASNEAKPAEPPPERTVETKASVTIRGTKVAYTATAGTYTLSDDDAKPKASVFFVSYTRDGTKDPADRPVLFAFNGGPGSSSVWLHLGVFGPRRVVLGEADAGTAPPFRLVDNDHSVLDLVDIVFVDPVSTGYSRPLEGEDREQFHGVSEDVEWMAEFIRLWTTRAGRWASPKYLAGESYGTARAAALAGKLQDRHGMYLNGVVLISAVLMFQTASPSPGNDIGYISYVPTMAATAWYHGRLDASVEDLEALVADVEDFVAGDYATVLMRGSRASDDERTSVAERLSRFTGLSVDFIRRSNLRIAPHRFMKELLREEARTVGRLDSRFTGIDSDAAGEAPDYDPSYAAIQGPYTATLNHYVRHDLEFENDDVYEILAGHKVHPWKAGELGEGRFIDVSGTLRDAMSKNRSLRVFLASGYFDLATPFFAAEWTLDHMGLDPSLVPNIVTKRYPAGHMMYVHEPSIRALRDDLASFLAT